MSEMMTFPDTWEEFEKLYGFNDAEEIYTNNSRLIPSFRVKQWLDHLPSVQPKERCIATITLSKEDIERIVREQVEEIKEMLPRNGKWIGYKADDKDWQRDDGSPIFMNCSECHEAVINNGSAHWNFCPNCGADMRGEQDDK